VDAEFADVEGSRIVAWRMDEVADGFFGVTPGPDGMPHHWYDFDGKPRGLPGQLRPGSTAGVGRDQWRRNRKGQIRVAGMSQLNRLA
jgi:hypothetical protein